MREQKAKEYLSTIYMLASYGAVRASYIAREMMVSRPSVSVALKTGAHLAGLLGSDPPQRVSSFCGER